MSHACLAPIAWERLVDYWAGDLDRAAIDDVEEHLFGCETCSLESARVARIAQALRTAIPPVVTLEQTAELRSRGLVVEENRFEPNERREVVFGRGVDILIHRLGGMDLSSAERVRVDVRIESTGQLVFEEHFAPFDRERGEVLIACQRHFAALPPDVAFEVSVFEPDGRTSAASFMVPHVFVP
jgi:hypothetical protein